MRKHNLKSYSVPRDPDRPLHYYWQNEVAKSEAILRTKRSRSTLHSDFTGLLFPLWTLTLLPAEWGSKIWSLTQHQDILIKITICHSARKLGTVFSRSQSYTVPSFRAKWHIMILIGISWCWVRLQILLHHSAGNSVKVQSVRLRTGEDCT